MRLLDQIPAWFRSTPGGRAMVEEAERVVLTERETDAAELAQLRKELKAAVPPLNDAVKAARAKTAKAAKALQDARDAEETAARALSNESHRIERAISRLEVKLRLSADPAIIRFQEEMAELWEKTRQTPIETAWYGSRNMVTRRPSAAVTNKASILRRMDLIRAASRAAEDLKLSPTENVATELAKIRATIPPIYPADAFVPVGADGTPVEVDPGRDAPPAREPWALEGLRQ